ncbi:NPCBM/NEW2 domain-containing protein [Lentisphaerota bacterium WC36G]|nr:NPCBM/NEW2 domain-containing protein [Lentisphaerae bacterium WC36]
MTSYLQKFRKLVFSVVIASSFTTLLSQVAKAADGKISFLTYNIAALPWPAYYDNAAGNPADRLQYIGQKIHPFDVVGVQEQFTEFDLLRQDIDHPYYTTGEHLYTGGSGLDLFSKYPMYGTSRIEFNDHPFYVDKGFTKTTVVLYPGVIIDVYNTHTGDDEDEIENQLDQLSQYIQNNSPADRPVVVMGDFNATLDGRGNMRTRLLAPNNLVDAYEEHYGNAGHDYWEIDRILYRNGTHVTFSLSHFEKMSYDQQPTTDKPYQSYFVHNGVNLSDHRAVLAELTFTVSDAKRMHSGYKRYISDIKLDSGINGWGPIGQDQTVGGDDIWDGQKMRMDPKSYDRGLGVHAPSLVKIKLDSKYSRFYAEVGIDEEVGAHGKVRFKVFTDGTKVFDSGAMEPWTSTKIVDIDVSNTNMLSLEVEPEGSKDYDHANWADAYLILK